MRGWALIKSSTDILWSFCIGGMDSFAEEIMHGTFFFKSFTPCSSWMVTSFCFLEMVKMRDVCVCGCGCVRNEMDKQGYI